MVLYDVEICISYFVCLNGLIKFKILVIHDNTILVIKYTHVLTAK